MSLPGRAGVVIRLRKVRKAVLWQARLTAVDAGWRAGQIDYRRFVLVGQGRSGSNFLRGLINSHPDALMYGELFRDDGVLDWGVPAWRTPAGARDAHRDDPVRFLDHFVFRPYPRDAAAVGFKWFYVHAEAARYAAVRARLLDDSGIVFLHLKRKDLLASLVSLRQAERTGRWVTSGDHAGRLEPPSRLRLEYDDCLAYFEQAEQWTRRFDALLPADRTHTLWYEDLLHDRRTALARVQCLLGLRLRELTPATSRQSHAPPRDVVENFAELQWRFLHTPWATLFEG